MPLEVLIRPTLRCWGCCGTPDAQVRGWWWFVLVCDDGKRWGKVGVFRLQQEKL